MLCFLESLHCSNGIKSWWKQSISSAILASQVGGDTARVATPRTCGDLLNDIHTRREEIAEQFRDVCSAGPCHFSTLHFSAVRMRREDGWQEHGHVRHAVANSWVLRWDKPTNGRADPRMKKKSERVKPIG
jgi:hypothetical protein